MKISTFTLCLLVTGSAVFLAGCGENKPQDQVLRDAEQYNIQNFGQKNDGAIDEGQLSVSVTPDAPSDNPSQNLANQKPPEGDSSNPKQPPAMQIDQNKTYTAVLKTSKGDITIDLDAKRVPKTVNNFVSLSRDGFYNGTIFHRVIADFMIQGGDPKGDGTGGPGYKFDDENLEGKYTRGTVAMANSGPNTNGSQFFIMHKDYDLPNNYVIFGHISAGMDAVDKIATAPTTDNGQGEMSKPVDPVKIDSIEITEK
jgi:cyclophilin family peptidyl-prolyl cis-trans isomerase